MKIKWYLILYFLFSGVNLKSQNIKLQWAGGIGGISYDVAQNFTTDVQGNIYLTGYFERTADFDPSEKTAYLTAYRASMDIYIAKYDPDGNYLWAKSIGEGGMQMAFDIEIDPEGNIYITGIFHSQTDFDPSPEVAILTGQGAGCFLAKYDADGNYLWAKNVCKTNIEGSYNLVVDKQGNAYVASHFRETIDFDPGPSGNYLKPVGDADIFLTKYNSEGEFVWAKGIGGSGLDHAYGLALDQSGNILLGGVFEEAADFNPAFTIEANLTAAGSMDVFVAKYSPNGSYIWAKAVGGTSYDVLYALSVTKSGNIVIAGLFTGIADFDPSYSVENLVSKGNKDIFIAQYDTYGNYLWAIDAGGKDDEAAYGITTDVEDNIYITGVFSDITDFDPSPNRADHTSMGMGDIFIARYNTEGRYIWSKTMGGLGYDFGQNLIITHNNDILIIGGFEDTVDFDSTVDSTILIASNDGFNEGEIDIFFAKYNQCNAVLNLKENTFIGVPLEVDYQWLDCDSGYQNIGAENEKLFIPSQDGNYALKITKEGCVDTSECIEFKTSSNEVIHIYPNPNFKTGVFHIEYGKKEKLPYIVINSRGQIVQTGHIVSGKAVIDLSSYISGIYFLLLDQQSSRLFR